MTMEKLLLILALFVSPVAYAADCPPLLDRTITTLQGNKINLCDYSGKPILVVNTASKCGYTPQFEKLEALYSKYQKQGLLVIGFPSNDFRQELNSNGEIDKFCKLTYKVKFPMSEPSSVKGKQANPLFKALTQITGEEPDCSGQVISHTTIGCFAAHCFS
jgi:glutathione peroxidase